MEVIIFSVVTIGSIIAALYLFGLSRLDFLKKNWVQYRCDPLYMPMAGFIGEDVVKNFTQCTMKGFNDYLGFVMDPVMYEIGIVTDGVSEIADSMNAMRGTMASVRGGFIGIIGTVYGKIQNTMSQTQYIVIRMRTLMARIVGVLMSFVYVFYGGMESGTSVMNGPIGKTVQML
jgi:hypothetical protein